MASVIFTIQYKIKPEKREEYLNLIKELKSLLSAEGLEKYSVYEIKGKKDHFQEVYSFNSEEAFENFDDDQSERMNILLNKLNDLAEDNSTKYITLKELEI